MSVIETALSNLGHLDELARGDSPVHRLAPLTKTLVTVVFLAAVASFPKYGLTGLSALAIYPIALIALGNLPPGRLLKRLALAAPFVVCVGILNPLFDQRILMHLGPLPISGGWLSFAVILFKFSLCVMAALVLIATTGFDGMCSSLTKLGLPRVFVSQLLLTYRYLYVLAEEATRLARAYALRAPGAKGIKPSAWGSLAGQLLLRTYDRAQRIHQAMLCRGFTGTIELARPAGMGRGDLIYLVGWVAYFIAARYYNLPQLLGSLLMGMGK